VAQHRADLRRSRKAYSDHARRPYLETRSQKGTPIEWRVRRHTHTCVYRLRLLDNFSSGNAGEFIDWSPFFTRGVESIYPRSLMTQNKRAGAPALLRSQRSLDRMIEKNLITARGVYGFFLANALATMSTVYDDTGARYSSDSTSSPAVK